eukprot:TRINITY_DN2266_c0_g1_i2.p1 TRINITY_DN2266_c0_g1~~TRINITY_DN2266_c0_g1_i2.p1  ORF type:complete len:507 (-),score=154.29 TRINITY_DN2266_c0_g1_i2:1262-2782(-)
MPRDMLSKETLRKLQDAPETAVRKVSKMLHLAIHPQYLGNIQLGIINYLNHWINRFHTELDGVLLGYGKVRLKEPKAEVLNEEHYLHLDIYSDFWIFSPQVDCILSGVVNKMSSAHVSVLVHGLFNVPCHKSSGEQGSEWLGSKVSVGDTLQVRILQMDMNQKVPFLLGEIHECLSVNEKREALESSEMILVENIKEEKVWEELMTVGQEGEDLQVEEEDVSSSKKAKKKKKKKKKSRDSDDESPKLSSSFVLSNPNHSLIEHSKHREDSPVLTQLDNNEDLAVPKKKKKSKKNRSLSPDAAPSLTKEGDKRGDPLLNGDKSTDNEECSSSRRDIEEEHEEKSKEDLSNSLILQMLSKEKKKSRRKSRNNKLLDNSQEDSLNESARNEPEEPSNQESTPLPKEKKSKKRKSLAAIQSDILLMSVNVGKRKRSLSESSTLASPTSKKIKVESLDEGGKLKLPCPTKFQEPRLPPGWNCTLAPAGRKTWMSPSGKKFITLKAAIESLK